MPTEPILAKTIAGIQRTLGTDLDHIDVLEEGGSGCHFFGRSSERVVLVRKTPVVASCAA